MPVRGLLINILALKKGGLSCQCCRIGSGSYWCHNNVITVTFNERHVVSNHQKFVQVDIRNTNTSIPETSFFYIKQGYCDGSEFSCDPSLGRSMVGLGKLYLGMADRRLNWDASKLLSHYRTPRIKDFFQRITTAALRLGHRYVSISM